MPKKKACEVAKIHALGSKNPPPPNPLIPLFLQNPFRNSKYHPPLSPNQCTPHPTPFKLYTAPFSLLYLTTTMAACSSLQSLFDNPLPENPTLIESLSSWNHHKPMKVPVEAEIFGELYFHEKPDTSHPPLAPKNLYRCDSFPTKNSESLQMCTEGLGSESSDDVDDLLESGDDWRSCKNGYSSSRGCRDVKSSTMIKRGREFPPPISLIGRNGRPRVCLRSYREDGRFVLREMRIPMQEVLRASREDGRLKLHFVHPDEDNAEGDEKQEVEKDEREVGEGENNEI